MSKKAESLKKTIRKALSTLNIDSSRRAIINLALSGLLSYYGIREYNSIVKELGLDKHGWKLK